MHVDVALDEENLQQLYSQTSEKIDTLNGDEQGAKESSQTSEKVECVDFPNNICRSQVNY